MPGNDYADGMWEHDQDVGKLLKQLDDLAIAKDTIVIYTTDNGPNMFSWPDAAMTPFRSEKDSNWEGAFRVPAGGRANLPKPVDCHQITDCQKPEPYSETGSTCGAI
jgi:arylsulfatase A-like enzyme